LGHLTAGLPAQGWQAGFLWFPARRVRRGFFLRKEMNIKKY